MTRAVAMLRRRRDGPRPRSGHSRRGPRAPTRGPRECQAVGARPSHGTRDLARSAVLVPEALALPRVRGKRDDAPRFGKKSRPVERVALRPERRERFEHHRRARPRPVGRTAAAMLASLASGVLEAVLYRCQEDGCELISMKASSPSGGSRRIARHEQTGWRRLRAQYSGPRAVAVVDGARHGRHIASPMSAWGDVHQGAHQVGLRSSSTCGL